MTLLITYEFVCPTCTSPAPHLHPAVQAEGEVHICSDDFHKQDTPENYRHLERTDSDSESVLIPWEVIDACRSADEIAALLTRHGIKGIVGDPSRCPLANATGWDEVGNLQRLQHTPTGHRKAPLTRAEGEFVENFDSNLYPELEIEDEIGSKAYYFGVK